MKKSLLLVPLVLSAIALPVRAVDPYFSESFYYGKMTASLVCEEIEKGVPSLNLAFENVFKNRVLFDRYLFIKNIEETRGKSDLIAQAYNMGTLDELRKCQKDLN